MKVITYWFSNSWQCYIFTIWGSSFPNIQVQDNFAPLPYEGHPGPSTQAPHRNLEHRLQLPDEACLSGTGPAPRQSCAGTWVIHILYSWWLVHRSKKYSLISREYEVHSCWSPLWVTQCLRRPRRDVGYLSRVFQRTWNNRPVQLWHFYVNIPFNAVGIVLWIWTSKTRNKLKNQPRSNKIFRE